ncbi:Fur family transcriptional regulator [Agrobacterium tumefaciens]|uniref:Fur family transcriptional regulator n=1 Tax=Agrobacterium tumefaciens TaxID=358 RepID=UPI003A5212DD
MGQTSSHNPHTHDWPQTLRAKGLRATTQRVKVLDYLHDHPHADAEAIFQAVRPSLLTTSLQAIHLIVQDLSAIGLIRRISPPDSASARYETRIEDNHHHIQCIKCGRIEDVDCVVGHAPCIEASNTHGMRVIEASIVFRGICHECEPPTQQRKEKPRRAAPPCFIAIAPHHQLQFLRRLRRETAACFHRREIPIGDRANVQRSAEKVRR